MSLTGKIDGLSLVLYRSMQILLRRELTLKTIAMVIASFWWIMLSGQESTLTIDQYVGIVKEHHPVTYQSANIRDLATANLTVARGAFDPKLGVYWDQKAFDGKDYYSIFSGGVKIPTWYGIDFKLGYDRNDGIFLDDSDEIPNDGLIYGGISVPIAQGLIIDGRRAEVKQAQIFINSSLQEQKMLLNDLLFRAIEQYLIWQEAFFNRNIAIDGVDFAAIRLEGTKGSYVNGALPAIDTLEAFISLQSRQLELAKAEQELYIARQELNNFLWINGEIPLELEDFIVPENLNIFYLETTSDSVALFQDELLDLHPELLSYTYEIQSLSIEERLNREFLKPDIRVDYNPLYEPGSNFQPVNEYKLGISANYPLLLRKERGKLAMTRVKILDKNYDLNLKKQELQVKLKTYFELQLQLERQNVLTNQTVVNYGRMLDAENRKFEIGESSIFLINNREIKYLESRYKLVEDTSKLIKSRLIYLLYSGLLNEVM